VEEAEVPDDDEAVATAAFYHDLPPGLAAGAMRREWDSGNAEGRGRRPEGVAGRPDWTLLCRDNRLFPADLMRRVVEERLGITPDESRGAYVLR
jgi:hypothetical protein